MREFLLSVALAALISVAAVSADLAEVKKADVEEEAQKEETTTSAKADYPKEDGVYLLGDSNFDRFLAEHPATLVSFYAPWCGHCKKLAPEYAAAAAKLETPIAKVDATIETALAKRFDIQGFPTLKFWRANAAPIDYDGGRDADSIVQWVSEKVDPNYKPPPEEVVTLTDDSIDAYIADKPLMLLEFYAPWCGHCKRLTPEYEKAAKRLNHELLFCSLLAVVRREQKASLQAHNIVLAKMDATVEKAAADKYGVSSFPTLKILRYGRRYDYDGPRDADGIVRFMLDAQKPAARELRTIVEARRLLSATDATIIGFFASAAAESPAFEAFTDAAETVRGDFTAVGYTTDPNVFAEFGASPNEVHVLKPRLFRSKYENDKHVVKQASFTTEELLKLWREHAVSLVGLRTRENVASRYGKTPLVVVYYGADFSVEHRKASEYWRKKILPIANKYKAKYNFAIANEEDFASEMQETGLGESGLEHNAVAFGFDGKKYPMRPDKYDEDDVEESLSAFMKDLDSGRVKPFVKSAPAPTATKGPVKTLVASTFEATLSDASRDYLVAFVAPWCGHCKAFEPKLVELAKRLKAEANLVLAKFDATANDPHEDFKVEGFPTIFFAPGGLGNKPIKYSGNRDLDDLIEFMKKHAKNAFKRDEL